MSEETKRHTEIALLQMHDLKISNSDLYVENRKLKYMAKHYEELLEYTKFIKETFRLFHIKGATLNTTLLHNHALEYKDKAALLKKFQHSNNFKRMSLKQMEAVLSGSAVNNISTEHYCQKY